jgi:hypothetical protein
MSFYESVQDLMVMPHADVLYPALKTLDLSHSTSSKFLQCEVCQRSLETLHCMSLFAIEDFSRADVATCGSKYCRLTALKSINAHFAKQEWLLFHDLKHGIKLKISRPRNASAGGADNADIKTGVDDYDIVDGQLVFARRSSDNVNISVGLRYEDANGKKYNGIIRLQEMMKLNSTPEQIKRLANLKPLMPPFYDPNVCQESLEKWRTAVMKYSQLSKS